jgi:catechol 2,3-dioxygenase-like lactoylglutathione lyase family enzyme
MQINRLDHVNLRTAQLETMMAWYGDILGLHPGARPDFGFPGAWLYAGKDAVVHLVGVTSTSCVGSEADLKMEHFAFTATDPASFEARLKATGTAFRRVVLDQTNTVAFNVWDPDGNHIHVDFPADT